jgi:hypothetical protein
VLAAVAEPSHPLFPICIRVLGGKPTPLPRKDIVAAISHAARKLPAHFTPRAAAIVATGLAVALRNLDENEQEEAGDRASPGITADNAALGSLLRFGVCCPEAAPEVSKDEEYMELLARIGPCAAHISGAVHARNVLCAEAVKPRCMELTWFVCTAEHPDLRAKAEPLCNTPRYTCLESLCFAAVKEASLDPEVVREAALPQSCLAELVEWLAAAGVVCEAGEWGPRRGALGEGR